MIYVIKFVVNNKIGVIMLNPDYRALPINSQNLSFKNHNKKEKVEGKTKNIFQEKVAKNLGTKSRPQITLVVEPDNSKSKRKIVFDERVEKAKRAKLEKIEKKQELVEVPVVTLKEFFTDGLYVDPSTTSQDRFKKLLSLCLATKNDNKISHSLWIEIPENHFSNQELWIQLIIDERPYDSQCFEECFQDYPQKTKVNQSYYFINACHAENNNQYYFQIRIDKEIKVAEIVHIERALEISGNDMKNICMSVLDFLLPAKIFLNDDAKIPASQESGDIALRVSLPIVSEIPRTWYPKFKPMIFDQIKTLENTLLLPQNEKEYAQAVELVRNTLISDLIKDKNSDSKLKNLMSQYIKDFNPCNHESYTLHLLGSSIYSAMKGKEKKQAILDFSTFYQNYLVKENVKANLEKYKKALDVLHNYKIWIYEA